MSLFNKLTLELYNIVHSIFLILLKCSNHWVSMSESKGSSPMNKNKILITKEKKPHQKYVAYVYQNRDLDEE